MESDFKERLRRAGEETPVAAVAHHGDSMHQHHGIRAAANYKHHG